AGADENPARGRLLAPRAFALAGPVSRTGIAGDGDRPGGIASLAGAEAKHRRRRARRGAGALARAAVCAGLRAAKRDAAAAFGSAAALAALPAGGAHPGVLIGGDEVRRR